MVGIWNCLLLLMMIGPLYPGMPKVRLGEMSLAFTQNPTGEQGLIFPHLVMEFFPCLMPSHSVSGRSSLIGWKFVRAAVKLVTARACLDGCVHHGKLLRSVS